MMRTRGRSTRWWIGPIVVLALSAGTVGAALHPAAATVTSTPSPAIAASATPSGVHTDVIELGATDGSVQQFTQANLDPFLAIGFSWEGPPGIEASVVLTYASGATTDPIDLDQDDAHSEDNRQGTRRVTDPITLDQPAVAFTLTVPAGLGATRAHLVRPDDSHAAADAATASTAGVSITPQAGADAIPGPEGIRSRESWGARERKTTDGCAPGGQPEGLGCVAKNGVVNAVVHHTVNANDYSAAAVPAMLRSIQAFHQDVDGFDDIGYNFIVDRFGTIWEGRAGGADRPVVGGHTLGFNTGSVGVAVLGTFDSAPPSDAALEALAQVIAWKFAQRNVDPLGQVTVVSNGGDVHPEGEVVVLNTIDGHRSIGATACPGAQLFSRLGDIRQRVAALIPLYTGEVTGLDRTSGKLHLSGFALRRDTTTPLAVTVSIDGVPAAQTVANIARSDVVSRFPAIGANHGFDVTVPVALSAKRACVTENLTGTLIGCRDANPITPPFGDFGFTTSMTPPHIGLSGWAIDPDSSEPTVVHAYVDGVATQIWADKARPDVASAFPGYGVSRGFSADIPAAQGAHQVCVYAINIPSGDHPLLGCREAIVGQVNRSAPFGALDAVIGGGASVLVSGWALDRDTTEPINVHVYVDSTATPIVASNPRADVAAAFPGVNLRSGFSARIAASPGPHTVCVYAIDANLIGPHALLGCRAVSVLALNAAPPTGALDAAVAKTGSITVAGWAIDPDTTDPIAVHVYIDATGTPATASAMRDDLARAFPQYGGAHGFAITLNAARGTHQVCVYAINNLAAGANTLLGCRVLSVT